MPTTLVPEEDATLGWRTDFDDVYKRGEMIGSSAFGQVSGRYPTNYRYRFPPDSLKSAWSLLA